MNQSTLSDDSDGNSNNDRYDFLRKARRRDMQEEYSEEMGTFNRKRPFSNQQTLSDDEEDDGGSNQKAAKTEDPVDKNSAGYKLMRKMGYKEGSGLGKQGQGISEPIALSSQRGRIGLGHEANKVLTRQMDEVWDESKEEKTVEERVEWFEACPLEVREEIVENLKDDRWIVVKQKKLIIDDEVDFCDELTLKNMLEAKQVFDNMTDKDLREARTRANPYETIGGAFFQNRAAMKTANLDRIYDWIFSMENPQTLLKKNPLEDAKPSNSDDRSSPLFYFADVCAGPGGFSEYMLWRKGFYNAKGFGFTLDGKDDFKLHKFCASSAYYFEPYYGVKNNGDVTDPENIDSLEDYVSKGTNGLGVHLMMADGGFSVEKQENLQEILSKRLYLCQLLVSLCIVREGGNFFCKLFDIFTPFSAGLVYLMRICYDDVSLHKPHTSRPANSERYIICKGLRKEFSDVVRDYLKRVNRKIGELKNREDPNDVQEIVPHSIMQSDEDFFTYLVKHNQKLAQRQTVYLQKYLSFSRNQGLFDKDQGNLRDDCLNYWMVPNRKRARDRERVRESLNAAFVLGIYTKKMMGANDFNVRTPEFSPRMLEQSNDKHYKHAEFRFVRLSERSNPYLLVATSDAIFVHKGYWERMENDLARIPESTILLVEPTTERVRNGNRISKGTQEIFRIIDAAVLNGDDVSMLSYEQRMTAARKFALALQRVNAQVRKGWGNRSKIIRPHILTVADVFSFNELENMKNEMELVNFQNESHPLFTESGYSMVCSGLRFCRVIRQDWCMAYSRSQSLIYAYNLQNKAIGSIFERDFERNEVWASFWDTAMMKENEKKETLRRMADDPRNAYVSQCVWKWQICVENTYGPRAIMTEDEHKGGPTVSSIMAAVNHIDKLCGIA